MAGSRAAAVHNDAAALAWAAPADLLHLGEAFAMLLVSLHNGVLLLLGGEVEPVGHGSDSEKVLDLLFGISCRNGTALHNGSDHRVKVREIRASRVELSRQSLTSRL